MTNSEDPDQTAHRSGSTLFASILKFVSNARQLFAADDFSGCHFQRHFFLLTVFPTILFFANAILICIRYMHTHARVIGPRYINVTNTCTRGGC